LIQAAVSVERTGLVGQVSVHRQTSFEDVVALGLIALACATILEND